MYPSTMDAADFETFWRKFLSDHPSSVNRWMHVAALAAVAGSAALALRTRSPLPLVIGIGVGSALAVVGHPLFQGDWPKNFGQPAYAARAFLRLCLRTIDGRAARELAEIRAGHRGVGAVASCNQPL